MGGVISALPAICIVLTLACIVTYHGLIGRSIGQLRELGFGSTPTKDLLEQMDATQIPYPVELAASYLGIFIFAELAFVLMAIREYLQDLLHLDEISLLRGRAHMAETGGRSRAGDMDEIGESNPPRPAMPAGTGSSGRR